MYVNTSRVFLIERYIILMKFLFISFIDDIVIQIYKIERLSVTLVLS